MPRMKYPNFCGPSYVAQSPITDCEQCFNLFPESNKAPSAKSQYSLLPTPGLSLLATADQVGGRAIFCEGSRAFCVIGSTFYEINSDFTLTSRATGLRTNANPATICANDDLNGEVFVTSGSNGYIFDLPTNTWTVVANLVGKADMGAHSEGFFLALQFSTSTVFQSKVDDGLTWDPNDFFQRSAFPDPWKSLTVTPSGQVLLLGTATGELWADVGTSPIAFAPIGGAKFKQGIVSPFSARALGSSMIWVAQNSDGNRTIQQLSGYNAFQVSTPPIDYALQQYDDISDAVPTNYDLEGHMHYSLNFPKANANWTFDQTEGFFHRRGSWNTGTARWDAWRAGPHAVVYGKHIVLDRLSGAVYQLGTQFGYDADLGPLRRMRIPPALNERHQMMYYSDLEVYMEVGLANFNGAGSNPFLYLESSRDGGKTYGHRRARSCGVAGRYETRVRWGTMHAARDHADRLTYDAPVPLRITDAYITVDAGTS